MAVPEDTIRNILLVRTDRIGDVVLSLPMLPLLKERYPQARVTVMVRPYTKELVEHHSCVDDVILWDESKGVMPYVSILKQRRFDLVILPYPRFNLALICFLAGIPVRVGTGYRWYSFLFNKRIYEHRKDARRHEVEYNLNLLTTIGINSTAAPAFEFTVDEAARRTVDAQLNKDGIGTFVVLHAGSGGSARDWSVEKFAQLGDLLRKETGMQVVLTGGAGEKDLVRSLASAMEQPPIDYAGRFSLQELAELFRRASVFVANSTGPLHIASMVGTPVVAFYPPIIQCSPARWGPYTAKKRVFTADNLSCPLCKGGPCTSNVCMDQITVRQVADAVKELTAEWTSTGTEQRQ
ncbi:MAG: glycosyltransferase family 9 protein [Bacteroidetes bacterium]|nr:glycosyltransferase family 9 protein [Bacteroidota bacterium]